MPSAAIESQGTTVEIGNSTTTPVTISGITLGGKTKITGTHALSVGDVVTFDDIVGTVQLNGYSYAVTAIETTVAFWIDVDSAAYTAWSSAGTATPATWTEIGDVVSASGPDGAASEIPISNLQSTMKEFLMGLPDEGSVALELNCAFGNAGQQACRAARTARSLKPFRMTYSDGCIQTWSGFVMTFTSGLAVDDKVSASVNIRISGVLVTTPA
jgi:hypothetical protein